MKKKLLLFVFILCIMACERENTQEVYTASTRVIPGQTVTGEKNPYVGESYYTYTVDLGNPTDQFSKLRITTLNNSALIRLNSSSNFESYNFSFIKQAKTRKFTFDIYWTKEVTNEIIFLTSDSDSPVKVETNISGINVKKQVVTINAPHVIYLGDKIELLAPYRMVNSGHRAVWKYDSNIFSKELEDYSEGNSQYRLVLKAKKGGVQSKISLDIDELFLYSNWSNVRKGEHTINITNPFKISTDSKYIPANGHFAVKMPDLDLVSGAVIKWIGGDGLSVVSGQNTKSVTFQASSTKNGYASVSANIEYNGGEYLEKIDSIWIGKPYTPESSYTYSMIDREIKLSAFFIGATNVDWVITEGKAELEGTGFNILVKSMSKADKDDVIKIIANGNNPCGITQKTFTINVSKMKGYSFDEAINLGLFNTLSYSIQGSKPLMAYYNNWGSSSNEVYYTFSLKNIGGTFNISGERFDTVIYLFNEKKELISSGINIAHSTRYYGGPKKFYIVVENVNNDNNKNVIFTIDGELYQDPNEPWI